MLLLGKKRNLLKPGPHLFYQNLSKSKVRYPTLWANCAPLRTSQWRMVRRTGHSYIATSQLGPARNLWLRRTRRVRWRALFWGFYENFPISEPVPLTEPRCSRPNRNELSLCRLPDSGRGFSNSEQELDKDADSLEKAVLFASGNSRGDLDEKRNPSAGVLCTLGGYGFMVIR